MSTPPPFWFIAQTGAIFHEEPQSPSNYYAYKLPGSSLGYVKLEIEEAALTPTGLMYTSEFYRWLGAQELNDA